jgi:hypothetical protein
MRPRTAEDCALAVTEADVSSWAGIEARAIAFCPGRFITRDGRVIAATKQRGIRFVRAWLGVRNKNSAVLTSRAVFKIVGCPQKCVAVSRLVCLAFNGPPPDGKNFVCHRDDVPLNNVPENLYWGDAIENADDCLRNQHRGKGLTNEQARLAIEASQTGATINEIARRFGVAYQTIENLLVNGTFRHIDGERVVTPYVSESQVILQLARDGMAVRDIAKRVSMPKQNIHETVSRFRRKGLLPRPDRKAA